MDRLAGTRLTVTYEYRPPSPTRPSYVSFGLAWLVGYGAFALAYGDDPIPPTPSVVLVVLLLGGLRTAMTITVVVTAKAQRGARGDEAVIGNLLAASWLVGFGALFLIITASSTALQEQHVHTLLWPTGSGVVVGLLYPPEQSPIVMCPARTRAPGLP